MEGLLLVGTDHDDPLGPKRLRKILEETKPSKILLEASPNILAWSVRNHDAVLERKGADAYENIIAEHDSFMAKGMFLHFFQLAISCSSGYEEWMSYAYGQAHSVEVLALSSEEKNSDFVIFLENLAKEPYFQDAFTRFTRGRLYETHPVPEVIAVGVREFDGHIEGRLREELVDRTIYIGGHVHLFGGYENLYRRLSDVEPTRIKLCDADRR